ncbi:unnamed protein product [Brassica rapa subsp. trilocularis]
MSLNSRHVGNLRGIQVRYFVPCSKHPDLLPLILACVHRSSISLLLSSSVCIVFPR